MNIVLLHGFWGAPQDFDSMISYLPPANIWVPNLFEEGPLDPSHSFTGWTNNFLRLLTEKFQDQPVQIAGYSQGARLALHAVLRDPERFERAWFLSAHPGQLGTEERSKRAEWIRTWKKKFSEMELVALAKEWDAQEVFAGASRNTVPKPEVSRFLLAQALENWSLLQHQFNWEDLRSLETPCTWAFGALDQKFLAVKESLQRQNVSGDFWVVERTGHRLLLDAPEVIARKIKEGMKNE